MRRLRRELESADGRASGLTSKLRISVSVVGDSGCTNLYLIVETDGQYGGI